MTPSPGTILRKAATMRSRRARIPASSSGIRTDIPCNSVMSKQRYQPFDGLHIGLAKTNGNRAVARAFFLVGRLPSSQREQENEVGICCGHVHDRDDSGCARTGCGRGGAIVQKML